MINLESQKGERIQIFVCRGIATKSSALKELALKSLMRRIRNKRTRKAQVERCDAPSLEQRLEKLRQQVPDASNRQIEIIGAVQHLTMTSPERIVALCTAVDYLSSNNIAGDFVECGVWRGGSMSAVARSLRHHQDINRRLWLYDTFDGMSEPTEDDIDFLGQTAHKLLNEQDRNDAQSVWCCSPLEQVKQTMAATGFPVENIHYVEGKVEATLPLETPEKIALLRLDTDWYESTRCELEYLFPKLVPGGVIIIDDYGHWEGCRRAVDEYFEKNQIAMLLNRIDYTGRIGIRSGVESP